MAIRFAPVAKVTDDVPIQMMREDGEYDDGDLRVTFKMESNSKFQELMTKIGNEEKTDKEVLRDRVLNVEGVLDADGNEREFSKALVGELADDPDTGPALIQHWIRLQTRRDKEAAKN